MNKRNVMTAAALTLAVMSAFAQGNGAAGITEATTMVSSYFDPATKLIYAIGAVVGLVEQYLLPEGDLSGSIVIEQTPACALPCQNSRG